MAIIDPAVALPAPPGVSVESRLALFSKMVDAQSVMLATNNFYAMATGLILIFAAAVWLAKRPTAPLKQAGH